MGSPPDARCTAWSRQSSKAQLKQQWCSQLRSQGLPWTHIDMFWTWLWWGWNLTLYFLILLRRWFSSFRTQGDCETVLAIWACCWQRWSVWHQEREKDRARQRTVMRLDWTHWCNSPCPFPKSFHLPRDLLLSGRGQWWSNFAPKYPSPPSYIYIWLVNI